MNKILQIKITTWKKESHDLFDYESNQIKIQNFGVLLNSEIYRKQYDTFINEFSNYGQVQIQNQKGQKYQSNDLISRVLWDREKNSYYIDNDIDIKNYLVVRSFQNPIEQQKGYEIFAGDIIKLGRVELRVIECKYKKGPKSIKLNETIDFKSIQEKNGKCRICYDNIVDEENHYIPINICNCKGSFEFYHFICLKKWIQSKVQTQTDNNITSLKTKFLECEVCKLNLPYQLKIDNKQYCLLDIEKPNQTPYIILEVLCPLVKKTQNLYIINFENTNLIKLGRGHAADIRISDISVSRFHASIQYQDDKFILSDNNSKFGTLILLQQKLFIQNEQKVIQIGKSIISFDFKKNESSQIKASNIFN